jgi:hypothetical protein
MQFIMFENRQKLRKFKTFSRGQCHLALPIGKIRRMPLHPISANDFGTFLIYPNPLPSRVPLDQSP